MRPTERVFFAGLLALGLAVVVAACSLTPAQDANAVAIGVNAACQEIDNLDPSLAANGLVELLCPQVPATTDAGGSTGTGISVTVNMSRVRTTRAAWQAIKTGDAGTSVADLLQALHRANQMTTAALARDGGGGG